MPQIAVNLDVFSTAREAIKGLASDISKLNEIPIKTRKKYIEVIDETMTLLDSALLLVIHRLGELLQLADDEFRKQLSQIDYEGQWMDMERSIRLCKNLRLSMTEMSNVMNSLLAEIALSRKDEVSRSLSNLLAAEAELAGIISSLLRELAIAADDAKLPSDIGALREDTKQARDSFRQERDRLIQDQIAIMNYIL